MSKKRQMFDQLRTTEDPGIPGAPRCAEQVALDNQSVEERLAAIQAAQARVTILDRRYHALCSEAHEVKRMIREAGWTLSLLLYLEQRRAVGRAVETEKGATNGEQASADAGQ
jgi:hypothetical protein